MSQLNSELEKRAQSKCELCSCEEELSIYEIPNSPSLDLSTTVLACNTCHSQINKPETMDEKHWYCLNDSIWSEHLPVQVLSYRILKIFSKASFSAGLSEQAYLDEDALKWAEAGLEADTSNTKATKDSNGAILSEGDSVTLIKDLVVKGANFTAKRGTLVKNISLSDNPEHIEGRVSGTRIVLLTCFLKKV